MSAVCIAAGIGAFVLFIIYDVNSVCNGSGVLKSAFFAGIILLAVATGGLLYTGWECRHGVWTVFFMGLAAVFLLLLIYTLFFALPFDDTYVKNNENPEVCSDGVYALCRHPGILWFAGMYACFAAALPQASMILGCVIFIICNVLYAVMQDIWTFPKCFSEYDSYKKNTPFILPTGSSIIRCIRTIRPERKQL